ncbi:MAG: hypothetical protein HOP08_19760 [Cyclobacteriaceae bacterium]|nr:hypothetical protein [Cyclobacteriaceae bacterium]
MNLKSSLFFLIAILISGYASAQEWVPVGGGINSEFKDQHNNIYDMLEYEGELYAVGSFTKVAGISMNYIAKWNGGEWSVVGDGLNAMASSLCIYKGELMVSGWFTKAGSVNVNHIAAWNGKEWHAVGSGFDSHPNDLVIYKDELYAGGEFSTADGKPARNIAKWNGKNWSALGKGVDVISVMAVYKDLLYTSGWAMDNGSEGINMWDGMKWLKGGYDVVGVPNSMIVYKDDLYFGGYFPHKGKKRETCIYRFDGKSWLNTGSKGTDGHIYSMLEYDGVLYTAGFFTEAEGLKANNIAKWDGEKWMSFMPGVNFHPHALVMYNGYLYAGGGYSSSESGEINKTMIARFQMEEIFDIIR